MRPLQPFNVIRLAAVTSRQTASGRRLKRALTRAVKSARR
jgi:hypothetical protein